MFDSLLLSCIMVTAGSQN